jgi:hypothetical protein
MENAIRKTAYRRFKKALAVKTLLPVLIGLALTLTGLPWLQHDSGWTTTGGAHPASAQALVEPFEGSGPIEAINENGNILIGDSPFKLADVVRFYKNFTKEEEISPTWFTVGKKVGFTVNQFGEIYEMWME